MKKLITATKQRALALTSAFEGFTGVPAGNFDGQLLSWGPLQWNVGQKTLMPVLRRIRELDPTTFEKLMGDEFSAALDDDQEFIRFVKGNVIGRWGRIEPEWRQPFKYLSNTKAATQAFVEGAEPYFKAAQRLCEAVGFETERGFALCFDTAVQNGAPRRDHITRFKHKGLKNGFYSDAHEWQKLKAFAHVVAASSNPRWQKDVASRKLTIAVGAGVVHGRTYDIELNFGIAYDRLWYTAPPPCGIERVFLDGRELGVTRMSLVGNKLYIKTKL